MAFPPPVYLINAPIIIYCTRSQENNCHTVYVNGLSVRHSYSDTLVSRLPVSAFAFPRLVYLGTRRLDDTLHTHTHTHTKSLIGFSIT